MEFDQRRYHQEVIVPLRDQTGLPDSDLHRQYAVEPAMDATQLRERLTGIRRLWNRKSNGIDHTAPVYARLKDRDERLRAEHGDAMFTQRWWREQAEKAQEGVRAESRRFADDLARAYGAVGHLTRAQLDGIAAYWPGLSEHGIDEAVRLAGLRIVDVVELPAGSGLSRTAYRELKGALQRLGLPTLVQLLHPDLPDEGFRLLSAPRITLDGPAVARQSAAAERLADTPALRIRKDALGLLLTAARQGTDLTATALFQIVERVQAGRARHLADGLLVRQATDAGLHLADAQVLVASLPVAAEPGESPAARIRGLLEDGLLQAAQQALAVLPRDDPAWAELHALAAARATEVTELRREADAALERRREDEAERLLRAAARMAADDEDLTLQLTRLAPPPPDGLAARPAGGGVRLTWDAPRTAAVELRYRVLRGDRPPAGPQDGDLVGETTERELADPGARPGRAVHYAVLAGAGGDWSRPATATVRPLPPVTAVRVQVQGHEVSCGWRVHPDATEVRVRRTVARPPSGPQDGTPVHTTRTGFVDVDAPDGADAFYGLVAVYRDEEGGEVAAPMVVARAVAAVQGPAYVERLRVRVTAIDASTARAQLSWPTPATGTVSVRRAELRPAWPAGSVVRREEIAGYGEPIVGDRLQNGPQTMVESVVPSGQSVYVPFTVDAAAGTAVVGEPVAAGVTESVRELRVRRIGGEIGLSWVWPPEVSLAEVTFTPQPSGPPVRRLVTRGQYAESGCHLRVGASAGTVGVRAVSRGRDGDMHSAPVTATVAATAVALRYHLRRAGGPLSRTRRLRIEVDQACDGVELILVVAQGPVMPSSPEQGHVLQHLDRLRFSPDEPWEVPFELPRLRKPYWLRCFVVRPAEIRVADPIDEMKVA